MLLDFEAGRFQLDDAYASPLLSAEVSEGGNQNDASEPTWLNRRLRDLLMGAPSAIGITVGAEHRWVGVFPTL